MTQLKLFIIVLATLALVAAMVIILPAKTMALIAGIFYAAVLGLLGLYWIWRICGAITD